MGPQTVVLGHPEIIHKDTPSPIIEGFEVLGLMGEKRSMYSITSGTKSSYVNK
jgi:hypothetical protein